MSYIRTVSDKIPSYQEFKQLFNDKNIYIDFDIDAYTDEELNQFSNWFAEMQHESLPLYMENLSKKDIFKYNLVNKNKLINENIQEYYINKKKILGKCVVVYPEFSIIKEENKNNFYRINNHE